MVFAPDTMGVLEGKTKKGVSTLLPPDIEFYFNPPRRMSCLTLACLTAKCVGEPPKLCRWQVLPSDSLRRKTLLADVLRSFVKDLYLSED